MYHECYHLVLVWHDHHPGRAGRGWGDHWGVRSDLILVGATGHGVASRALSQWLHANMRRQAGERCILHEISGNIEGALVRWRMRAVLEQMYRLPCVYVGRSTCSMSTAKHQRHARISAPGDVLRCPCARTLSLEFLLPDRTHGDLVPVATLHQQANMSRHIVR